MRSLNSKKRDVSYPGSIKHLSNSKKSNLTNPYEVSTPDQQMTPQSIIGSRHNVNSVSPVKNGHKAGNLSMQEHYNYNS